MKKVKLPLSNSNIGSLKAGEIVLLDGTLFTARDAAHKRLFNEFQISNFKLKNAKVKTHNVFSFLKSQTIYYAGPSPAAKGRVIGSCGPTTSARMDVYTPFLLKAGIKGMIGKGRRSDEVVNAIKKYRAVYFVAIGGAGAFYSKRIKRAKVVAYKDLGPEAIYKLEVENFPVVVGIDSRGRTIYK
jgi:fumarate hydratase subunit beta